MWDLVGTVDLVVIVDLLSLVMMDLVGLEVMVDLVGLEVWVPEKTGTLADQLGRCSLQCW